MNIRVLCLGVFLSSPIWAIQCPTLLAGFLLPSVSQGKVVANTSPKGLKLEPTDKAILNQWEAAVFYAAVGLVNPRYRLSVTPVLKALRNRYDFFSKRAGRLAGNAAAATQFQLHNNRAILEANSIMKVISFYQGNNPDARTVMEKVIDISLMEKSVLQQIERRLKAHGRSGIWIGKLPMPDGAGGFREYKGITWEVNSLPPDLRQLAQRDEANVDLLDKPVRLVFAPLFQLEKESWDQVQCGIGLNTNYVPQLVILIPLSVLLNDPSYPPLEFAEGIGPFTLNRSP